MTLLLGLFIGAALGFFTAALLAAASRADDDAREYRIRELLRQSANRMDMYGELRPLARAIRRELSEDAGA